eukprot:9495610-Pyramimonas_sp.AAC.1
MMSSVPEADPEFDANRLPLLAWSRAAREGWVDAPTLRRCFEAAERCPNLAWSDVRGPDSA